jgi:hypothetical protein
VKSGAGADAGGAGSTTHQVQEGIYDRAFHSSTPLPNTANLCPLSGNVSDPENLLKIKGQGTNFSPAKPENILKRKPLTNNCRTPEMS